MVKIDYHTVKRMKMRRRKIEKKIILGLNMNSILLKDRRSKMVMEIGKK